MRTYNNARARTYLRCRPELCRMVKNYLSALTGISGTGEHNASACGWSAGVGVLRIGSQPVNNPLNEPAARFEATKRTARILEIVQLVAGNPRRYRRADLAQRFEISERMTQKDLDIIRHGLKLLLCNDRSGYFFDRLPQLPTTPYSFSEALALLIAARTAQLILGVNSADLAAAIARLEAIFPDTFHSLLRDAIERLPQRADKAHRQAMLTLLHRALIERRQIRIVYAVAARGGATGERIVEPYHMMPYGRSWYLIAFDHKQQGILQFKIDRILIRLKLRIRKGKTMEDRSRRNISL